MDLNYKGEYNEYYSYYTGDVVKFTDDVWYVRRPADSGKAGYPCNDSKRWGRADTTVATAAEMAMEAAKKSVDPLIKISTSRVTANITAQSGATVFASGATNTYSVSKNLSLEAFIGVKIFKTTGLSAVSPSGYAVTEAVVAANGTVSIKIKNISGDAITATKANPSFTLDLYYID